MPDWTFSKQLFEPNLLIPGRKPTGSVRINWLHSHTRGLETWVFFGPRGAQELTRGVLIPVSSGLTSPSFAVRQEASRNFGTNSDNYRYKDTMGLVPVHAGARTFLFRAWINSSPGNVSAFGSYGIGYSADRCQVHLPWEGLLMWDYGYLAGDGRIGVDISSYYDQWVNWAVVSAGAGGTFKAIYANGVEIASAASSDGPSGTSWTGGFDWGGWTKDSSAYHFNGFLSDFRSFNRVLPASEIDRIHNDYWASLEPSGLPEWPLIGIAAPAPSTTWPHGPLGHPLQGALGGPI